MGLFQKILTTAITALAVNALAAPADSVMTLSKKWFDSGKAWNFDFKIRVDYAGSPQTGYQRGNLLVTGKDMFRLQLQGMGMSV